ncbi:MAG: hypothetical protein GY774_08480 [Planctomycetes bacterium]|nr:hypothetical protein [Planctomycetota bacterium]
MVRYYFNAKTTVEQALQLSIFKLREFGLLVGYCSSTLNWILSCSGTKSSIGIVVDITGKPYAKVNYTITERNTGEKAKYDYKIQLTTTSCYYGGVRYWFICPLSRNGVYCGRRVAKLYKAPGTHYFACRHCYNLSYDSRNEPRLARPGGIGYPIIAERLYEELYMQIRRWTYKGKPTKKAQKLYLLEKKISQSAPLDINELLKM